MHMLPAKELLATKLQLHSPRHLPGVLEVLASLRVREEGEVAGVRPSRHPRWRASPLNTSRLGPTPVR